MIRCANVQVCTPTPRARTTSRKKIIDNSVDEALAGHAKQIDVILHKDGSLSCADDGRGMPVDLHPEQKKPGVEVILTTLHAGGKFSNKNYQFSGGLHGVGVSVVNALSTDLEVLIKRDGQKYRMTFKDGNRASDLEVLDAVPKKQTGTTGSVYPDAQYFDSVNFMCRACAMYCAPKQCFAPVCA